jgi:protocatechuate 3,4-dioxygenase beta subunit
MKRTLLLLALLYFGPFLFLGPLMCPERAARASEGNASSLVLTNASEPGERLVIEGTLYDADGETPLPGVVIHLYHTDAEGYYSPNSTRADDPRIQGDVRTDARGNYRVVTIRPGAYPDGRVPAHVHYVVDPEGPREQRFELFFEGDPHLSPGALERSRGQGKTAAIQPLEKNEDGTFHVTRDLRLDHP